MVSTYVLRMYTFFSIGSNRGCLTRFARSQCNDRHCQFECIFSIMFTSHKLRLVGVTCICIYYIPPPLTVHFPMMRSVRYQPILHTLYYMLHTEHAYCLSYRFLNNVVLTTVIEMVEMN